MQESPSNIRVEPNGLTYHFYISGDIGPPEEYVDLNHTLRTSGPEDVIVLHINSPGGHLASCVQIIQSIWSSNAQVVGSAEGHVMSGGSLLFFACPNLSIGELSTFMIHDGYCGGEGKLGDNLGKATADAAFIRDIYNKVYYPFLSRKEIKKVLKGQDLYLTAAQVQDRVESLINNNEEEYVQATNGELVPELSTTEEAPS